MLNNQLLTEFEQDLLTSIKEVVNNDFVAKHSPAEIIKHKKGRPIGSLTLNAKSKTSIRFGNNDLAYLRSTGKGWQTRLSKYIAQGIASGAL